MKTDAIGKLCTDAKPVIALVEKAEILEPVVTTESFVPANYPVALIDQDGERTLAQWDNHQLGWIDGSTLYYVPDTMQNAVVGATYYVSQCSGTNVQTGRPCMLDDYTIVRVDKRDGGLVCVTATVLSRNSLHGKQVLIPCNAVVVLFT